MIILCKRLPRSLFAHPALCVRSRRILFGSSARRTRDEPLVIKVQYSGDDAYEGCERYELVSADVAVRAEPTMLFLTKLDTQLEHLASSDGDSEWR